LLKATLVDFGFWGTLGEQEALTRLASIKVNHLSLTCDLCGYNGQVPVTMLIQAFGPETSVHDAAKRARCTSIVQILNSVPQALTSENGWPRWEGRGIVG
jgi:hypothetical protein